MEYTYARKLESDGLFDIDNPNKKDGTGKRIRLAKQIEVAIPNKQFLVRNNGTICKIIFKEELISSEKTTLDTIVKNHKEIT